MSQIRYWISLNLLAATGSMSKKYLKNYVRMQSGGVERVLGNHCLVCGWIFHSALSNLRQLHQFKSIIMWCYSLGSHIYEDLKHSYMSPNSPYETSSNEYPPNDNYNSNTLLLRILHTYLLNTSLYKNEQFESRLNPMETTLTYLKWAEVWCYLLIRLL